MDVVDNVEFIQLDMWNLNIQDVIICPPGSAMQATLDNGNIPVYTQMAQWRVMDPSPNA